MSVENKVKVRRRGKKSCPGQLQEFNSIVFDWHEYDLKLERK